MKTIEPLVRIAYPTKSGAIHELRLWENTSCINTEDLLDFMRMAWKLSMKERGDKGWTRDVTVTDYAGEGGVYRVQGRWRGPSTLRILSTEKVASEDSSIDLFELLAAGIYPQEAVEDLLVGICRSLHLPYKTQERLAKMWKDVPFRIKAPTRRSAEGMAFQHRMRLYKGYSWSTIPYITRVLRNSLREMSILARKANRTELPEGMHDQCAEIQRFIEVAYEHSVKAEKMTLAVTKRLEELHEEKNDETDS